MTYTLKSRVFLKAHWVAVSLILAVYGWVFLFSVLLSGWTISNWGEDLTGYPLMVTPLLPAGWIAPAFFVSSIPPLIIGTVGLCYYSIRGINPHVVDNREHVAVLLVAFGFSYQILGAWPLGSITVFQWQWQKDIVSNPFPLVWLLYLLSLAALLSGSVSLFIHSRIYHQKHPSNSDALKSEQNGF